MPRSLATPYPPDPDDGAPREVEFGDLDVYLSLAQFHSVCESRIDRKRYINIHGINRNIRKNNNIIEKAHPDKQFEIIFGILK